jgi:cytoskeletal protein CcmA (bactofilin family)
MSLSTFGRGRTGEDSPMSSVAAPSSSTSANLTAFIDQGSSFEGKLSFKDTVRIDGGFQGEITSENTLIVGETGEVTATIRSSIVVVSGLVVGDIHATSQVVLHKTARVDGDVDSPSLVVEEGATLNGTLRMGKNAGKSQAAKPGAPAPVALGGSSQKNGS